AISGSRVSQVEYQFKETRMAMVGGESPKKIKGLVDDLKGMLVTDAGILDGGAADNVNKWTTFLTSAFGQAFIVLLREGLEAILVVAAIIAYLVKSGYKSKIRYIYWGILAGLAGSGLVAILFTLLFNGNGPEQEILEGVVALIAMVMLLYTSNWMLSKSSVDSWNRYIKNKTVAAISQGSVISLALLSFLAVFREGAETVMFYQAIFAMAPSGSKEIWTGFAAAAVVLVIIFVLIRFTSVKIPIRPFFVITSALMAIMVVIFAGGGVHALIEGDLVPATYLPGVPTSDWIGLYPYVQSIGAQVLALVVVIVFAVISIIRKNRKESVQESGQDD
ncbi:MAG: FTR1 family iron permease, partial [Bifidobacteriales bacterium]|nr:FTR1 family iron permease [Bifidobacteriales bacterium]